MRICLQRSALLEGVHTYTERGREEAREHTALIAGPAFAHVEGGKERGKQAGQVAFFLIFDFLEELVPV